MINMTVALTQSDFRAHTKKYLDQVNDDETVLKRVCEGAITELLSSFNNHLGLVRVGE